MGQKRRPRQKRQAKKLSDPTADTAAASAPAESAKQTDSEEKKAYEARLQRRLKLLQQYLEEGRIKFAPHLKVVESLKAVRSGPEDSVDLSTVDGLVRSLALAIEGSHEREEMKKAMSLAEIQSIYFQFLDNNFGDFFKIMTDRGLTPHEAGEAASRTTATIEEITKPLPHFLKTIEEFWANSADIAYAHVEDMQNSLKGVFGGDFFPSHGENIASKCGIYTDTIILPDPFLRTRGLFARGTPKDQAYYLLKHALNLLQYRDLACADVTPPIVVILPDHPAIDNGEREFLKSLASTDAVMHARKVFGRPFQTINELAEFVQTLDTVDRLANEVADPKRVLFNAEAEGDYKVQITEILQRDLGGLMTTKHPGLLVGNVALGQMSTANELLIKARRLRGTPVLDAPTAWQYFVWKLEYDATKAQAEINIPDLHVVRGLQSLAANEMQWLGRVPPESLIELRKTQALGEIRNVLGSGISELARANPTNFFRTTDKVFDNIQKAFEEHRKKIKTLTAKKWKFAGSDIGSWLMAGTLEVAAAATGYPTYGFAAYAAKELLNAPKLREIPKSVRGLIEETRKLKLSPVGMLFQCSQKS